MAKRHAWAVQPWLLPPRAIEKAAPMDAPWFHDILPPGKEFPDRIDGYVIEHEGWYWTGHRSSEPTGWTRNPRQALVEICSAWSLALTKGRGRVVRVLLETEATMLPLRHWPALLRPQLHFEGLGACANPAQLFSTDPNAPPPG